MSEELETPQSRTEEILQNALGGSYDVEPQSRVETLLTKVIDSGGGSADFIVSVSVVFDDQTGNPVIESIDKTFEEVKTAYINGAHIKAKVNLDGDPTDYFLSLTSIDISDGDSTGARFKYLNPMFTNESVTDMLVFSLEMFEEYTDFLAGTATF